MRSTGQGNTPASTAVRIATRSDVPAISAIESAVFSDPWSVNAFRSALANPAYRVTVAIREGNVTGYAVVRYAADEAELANIATAPAARRLGVGRALLEDAIATTWARGVNTIYLEVRVSNEEARLLYGDAGFRAVGTRRRYYSDPVEDALIMALERPE